MPKKKKIVITCRRVLLQKAGLLFDESWNRKTARPEVDPNGQGKLVWELCDLRVKILILRTVLSCLYKPAASFWLLNSETILGQGQRIHRFHVFSKALVGVPGHAFGSVRVWHFAARCNFLAIPWSLRRRVHQFCTALSLRFWEIQEVELFAACQKTFAVVFFILQIFCLQLAMWQAEHFLPPQNEMLFFPCTPCHLIVDFFSVLVKKGPTHLSNSACFVCMLK